MADTDAGTKQSPWPKVAEGSALGLASWLKKVTRGKKWLVRAPAAIARKLGWIGALTAAGYDIEQGYEEGGVTGAEKAAMWNIKSLPASMAGAVAGGFLG